MWRHGNVNQSLPQVFTDYTTLRQGSFLALPMDQFEVWVNKGSQRVFALEVFVALALFSTATDMESKLRFCFHLFVGNRETDYLTMVQRLVAP